MCGIMGYVGNGEVKPILVEGLRRLEYRGYDSAGIAVLNGSLAVVRSKGSIADLTRRLADKEMRGTCGIGHTRWATHGEPSARNAHPHRSCDNKVAVVHNGIIENHAALRMDLTVRGHAFRSQTDTEVLAHLVEQLYEGDLAQAVKRALRLTRGTFGAVFLHKDEPDRLIAARRGSPLVIGIGEGEHFVASDVAALVSHTRSVVYLEDDQVADVTRTHFTVSPIDGAVPVTPAVSTVDWEPGASDKGAYEHYMLKEICEQPEVIRNTMRGRTIIEDGIAKLGGLESVLPALLNRRHLVIIACGTSYYAGLVGRYMLEELTDLTIDVDLASEFRYRSTRVGPGSVVLAISQSGETADTLAAIREARRKGALCLGIVNVVGSSIARETEAGVYTHAGPEIGVASTKAFMAQLVVLPLIGLLIGRHRNLSVAEGRKLVQGLLDLPDKVERVIHGRGAIRSLARDLMDYRHFAYIGRRLCYPIALEGALKLKEIAYVQAEGYAAGELKHGPIALIDPSYTAVCIVPRSPVREKCLANIEEIKARGARIVAVATEGDEEVQDLADDVLWIPDVQELLAPLLATVPVQLLAYYHAALNGRAVDKPRNLAKSVTVE